MTNQQRKQKAIQEAYERIGLWEDLPEHVKEYAFANNGFIKSNDLKDERHKKVFECNIGVKWSGEPDYEYRINDLTGIDTNNGWQRISEDGSNLPNKSGKYHVVFKSGNTDIATYNDFYSKWMVTGAYYLSPTGDVNITHYRPVTELPKPIY